MKLDLKSASITLSNTLSNVHLRLEDFPKKDFKVVVYLSPWVNYRELTVNKYTKMKLSVPLKFYLEK